MTESIAFGIGSAVALLSAVYVVRTANLVHAALWLGLTLLATAGRATRRFASRGSRSTFSPVSGRSRSSGSAC